MSHPLTHKKEKVMLALSGGVDSVASAILLMHDYDVEAVTFRMTNREASPDDPAEKAADVASALGLSHRTVDLTSLFRERVLEPFFEAWRAGKTPNPCVLCNPSVKFHALVACADAQGCARIATGHYARVDRGYCCRAVDPRRDQSYFLYRLSPEVLRRVLFPVGHLRKDDVRAIAASAGLGAATEKDSQDLCFLGETSLRDQLRAEIGEDEPGPFLDLQGNVIGEHHGIWNYTVGQRRHLGAAFGRRMTVVRIDPARRAVVLGDEADATMDGMTLTDCYFPYPTPSSFEATVKLRSQGKDHPVTVERTSDVQATVRFVETVRLTSPGQSAVFYDRDRVLGGGVVETCRSL